MKAEPFDRSHRVAAGHITLPQLRAFAAAAEAGSLTEAASRLGMSQPALSRAIHELETALGGELFVRRPRGVSPAAAAAYWLPFARRVLASHDEMLRSLAPWREGGAVALRVAGSNAVLPHALPVLAPLLQAALGASAPQFEIGYSEQVERRVLAGQADLALCVLLTEHPELRRLPLLEVQLGLLTSPALALPPTIGSLADLRELPLVRFRSDGVISTILRQHGIAFEAYERSAVVVDGVQACTDLVAEGGMAMLASGIAATGGRASTLRFTPLPGLLPRARIGLIWRRDFPADARVEHLKDLIRQGVNAVAWHPDVVRLRPGPAADAADAAQPDPDPVASGDAAAPAAAHAAARRGSVDLRQVRAFLALAAQGSFTLAAQQVARSQSALSRQIRDFEQELGVSLFRRTGQGVQLTEAGQALQPHALQLQRGLEQALDAWQAWRPAAPGARRLACCPTLLPVVLPMLLQQLPAAFANGTLTLRAVPSQKVAELAASGQADFGICSSATEGAAQADAPALLLAPLGLLVHPEMALPGRIESLDDLRGVPLARVLDETPLTHALRARGLVFEHYFNASVVCDSMAAVFAMVREGQVASIVSALAASNGQADTLRFIPLPALLPPLKLCVVGPPAGAAGAVDESLLPLIRQSVLQAAWRPEVQRLPDPAADPA